jgi:hypothetical protein
MKRICAIFGVLVVLQGCYNYAPLETGVPPVGETVELRIGDRGRLELAERLGRGVSEIEGRLTSVTEREYQLNVTAVSYLNGERSRWGGESIRLDRDYVETSAVRTLSKRRTWIAAAVVAVGIGAFIATRGLLVDFLGGGDGGPNPEPPPSSLRPIAFP